MQISLAQKLKLAMNILDINQLELAKRTDQKQQNLSQKILADNFKFSEYEKLVTALGCELEVTIKLPNGERL